MARKAESRGSGVLVPVVGAFAGMSLDGDVLADVIASALAADHIQFISTSALEADSMYEQRTRAAWGQAAHRGWIVHRPWATRSPGGIFDDEEQQRHDDDDHHSSEQFDSRASDWARP